MWNYINLLTWKNFGSNLEQIACLWLSNKKNEVFNTVNAALMWTIWKYRNNVFFRSMSWSVMQVPWRMLLKHLRMEGPLYKRKSASAGV